MDIKEFLRNNIELVDENNYEELYKLVNQEDFMSVRLLTSFLLQNGVNPLNYMYEIPECFRLSTRIKTFDIPSHVKSIGDYAFRSCSSLESITIPDSVTSIGGSAFCGCSSLTSVTIGDSVESIGGHAFESCSSLTSIEIPNSVESIGSFAFAYCSSLTSVTYNGTKEQWKKISKGSDWKYSVPKTCKVYCSNGTITS